MQERERKRARAQAQDRFALYSVRWLHSFRLFMIKCRHLYIERWINEKKKRMKLREGMKKKLVMFKGICRWNSLTNMRYDYIPWKKLDWRLVLFMMCDLFIDQSSLISNLHTHTHVRIDNGITNKITYAIIALFSNSIWSISRHNKAHPLCIWATIFIVRKVLGSNSKFHYESHTAYDSKWKWYNW